MSSNPALPDPADRATQRDEDAQYHRQVLQELVEIGSRLACAIDRQAAPETNAAPAAPEPAAQAAERRRLARKQIIRTVEDCIQRETSGREAEALHAELYERLETIDADDDIETLPVAEIIALIRRDLGIANLPGTHPWKRRRPADVRELCARAAKPRTPQPWSVPAHAQDPAPACAAPAPGTGPPHP